MLKVLREMFLGKLVYITHVPKHMKEYEGICRAVHKDPNIDGEYYVELGNGERLGLNPKKVTLNMVEGPVRGSAWGQRKIQVIESC